MTSLFARLALVLVLAAVVALPARAQIDSREAILLQNQIAELRQEVQQLRDQVARLAPGGGSSLGGYQAQPAETTGGGGGTDLTAQLLSRVQRLEDEVRSLRGRVDEADNARQRQAEDLNKQIGDLNFKIDNGMAGAAAPGAPAAPSAPAPGRPPTLSPPPGNLALDSSGAPVVPVPPPPPAARRTPEMILQEGNAAYARREFAMAEAAAKTVLAAGGPRTTDAQFLLAKSLYGARDFSGAAVAFDDTYNRNHAGVHAQDALVGLANALVAINEKKAACVTLDKLAAEFPAMRPELRIPAATARRDAGCR